jgi:regulator of sigma E protease
MDTGLLGGVIFVLVFAGMILLHEIGHFAAARLFKIDVEEFGIGIPPRLARLWRAKGWLIIGQTRLEIPVNTDLPFDAVEARGRVAEAVAVKSGNNLALRSIALAASEDGVVNSTPAVFENPDGTVSLRGALKEIHEGTQFTLNWLPLGGFNRIKGEDDPAIPGGMAAAQPWKRLIVLLAGVTMNLLTAVLAYSILFSQIGIPDRSTVVIYVLEEGSPAEQAGIRAGDIVRLAAGEEIGSTEELISITHQNLGQPMEITLERDGVRQTLTVTPRTEWPQGSGPMGVQLTNPFVEVSWFEALPYSFEVTAMDMGNLLSLPGRLIAGTASPQEAQIGGPRTLWNLFQAAVASDVQTRQDDSGETQPTYYTLGVIIALSVSLGTFNLLPIPALDGGRILFLLPELLFRRPIPAKFQATVNGAAFILLMALLLFFYVKDFINPITFTLP